MRQVSLTSNGDGTGRLVIVIEGVRVEERKPGIYDLCALNQTLPHRVKCQDELLRAHLVVRLYCKSPKPKRLMKMRGWDKFNHQERFHAG